MSRRTVVPAVVVLTLVLCLPGCGGGGGGDDGDDGGPCVSFLASSAPDPSTVVAQPIGTGCGSVEVDLLITDVADVYSFSVQMTYDPAVVTFDGVSTAGTLLASGGNIPFVELSPTPGSVRIGVTRVGPVGGVTAVGIQVLAKLMFSRNAGMGGTPLTFADEKVLGSETPPVEKPNIDWFGGSFSVP